MGFRSTLCTQHYDGNLPDWFTKKYSDRCIFPNGILVVSKTEFKFYSEEFFQDYQKSLLESGFFDKFTMSVDCALLHEDGVISKVKIYRDEIIYYWFFDIDVNEQDGVWIV